MTKTENYNLPQWAEEDPVRREDFNGAMAGIDAALADNYAEQKRDLQTSLRQMEWINYNLYLSLLEGRYSGRFTGPMQAMCCNALTTEEELAAVSGDYLERDGGGVLVGSGTALTLDMLNRTITEQVDGDLPSAGTVATASVTFSCVRPGTLTGLGLWLSHTGNSSSAVMSLTVRLFDLDSQSYTYTSSKMTTDVLTKAEMTQTLTIAAPLERGHTYRLEVEKTGSISWTGTFGIGTKGQQDITGTLEAPPGLACSAAARMTAPAGSRHAMAVVRYSGDAGVPVVKLDGQSMTAGESRQVNSVSGVECTEQLYSLEGEFGGSAALAVQLAATADTRMILHDFGGMLL